ncbi:MAG: HAD family hydrolase [Anaerolineae bacterium]
MGGSRQARRLDGVRAVLFDFDGTLVRQSIDFARMRTEVLDLAARFGVEAADLARLPALEIMASVAQRLEATDGGQASIYLREAARAIEAVEMAAVSVARPHAGVPGALEALADRGFAIGIVTRNCRRVVGELLTRYPLAHHALLTRDDVAHVKPDPRHLHDAAQRLGVPIESCMMCGDHPMDVAAGRAAGAFTAAVVYEDAAIGRDRFVGPYAPDLVVESVPELVARVSDPAADGDEDDRQQG